MDSLFEVIECEATEVQSEVQTEVQSAASADCSASTATCSESQGCSDLAMTYAPHEVAEKLTLSIRSVYSYANKLIEIWSWLPESEFRRDGRYTLKALEEMKKLKESRSTSEYASQVTAQTGNFTKQSGQLARVEVVNSTSTLAAKPLPEIPVFNIKKVDVTAIRQRTKQIGGINQQLSDTMKALIAAKVENKVEELDAKIDEVFAEAENFAITQATQSIYQSVTGQGQQQ